MAINKEQLEIKSKVERLGMLLVENSEKIVQMCIDTGDVINLDEVLLLLHEKLNIKS